MSKNISNAEAVADALHEAGVRFIFGIPGGEVVELIEAAAQRGIQFILMGHESAAAFAAGTLGAATGIPGVCLATLGPGACNLVLGVGEAFLERHPLIAITARTAHSLDGNGTHRQVADALSLAATRSRGPVYLSRPGDLAAKPTQPESRPIDKNTPSQFDERQFLEIETALKHAARPVAIIGMGLDFQKDCNSVRHFLEKTGMPFLDTPKSKGVADPNAENFLGTCLSASGDALFADYIRQSDCVLGIGFDPVETTYDWHVRDHFFNLANASTAFNTYSPHRESIGPVAEMLDRLGENIVFEFDLEEAEDLRESVQQTIKPEEDATDKGLSPFHMAALLRNFLPRNTRLSLDTGQHKMLLCQTWQTNKPLSFFCSKGLSSMGPGVPGAIALALDDPSRPAVCITGDGGFGMMVQELETINRLDLTPLIIVFCDQVLSLIRIPQKLRGYPSRGIDLTSVDWPLVAKGFGINGLWIRTFEDLESAVSSWVGTPTATVLAVQIDEGLYRGNSY